MNSGGFRVDPPFDRTSGRYPADGTALRIVREDGGPPPNLETPETGLPIRLADFTPSDFYPARAPSARELTVTADGNSYLALAWAGQDASAASRRLLDQVVASTASRSATSSATRRRGPARSRCRSTPEMDHVFVM